MRMKRSKIESSALSYAISFMLLVGLLAAALLFLSGANKRLETIYTVKDHLLLNNLTALKWGLAHGGDSTELVHSSGDTSHILSKDWGVYQLVHVKTQHPVATVEKTGIGGVKAINSKMPVLVIPNKTDHINLCGNTLLEGNIYVTDRGLKRGHLTRKSFTRDKLYVGSLNKSEKRLPPLNFTTGFATYQSYREKGEIISALPGDSTFSFYNTTAVFSSLDAVELANSLSGNIVVHSFDQIRVRAQSELENVILVAPRIVIEKGFVGTLQAIATEEIFCEENVVLNYPSALIMYRAGRTDSKGRIFLDEGTRVLGGILLYDKDPYFRNPLNLELNNAMVGGIIYNTGESEIRGQVYGSLFTEKLVLHAGGGTYENYLLDATISSVQVPDKMLYPVWASQLFDTKSDLIACF